MDNQIEYRIDFTDITLNETDGIFKDVKEIMLNEFPFSKKWVLRSTVTIVSSSGAGVMEIQCHADGNVYIVEYDPSIGDVFYNNDLQVISMWARESGWEVPQPHYDLVRANKEFWKHFYDTMVIDSDYLDELYGKRPQMELMEKENAKKNKRKKKLDKN